MDRIFIKGMKFYGYHGVLPEENFLGQRFTVDIEMFLNLREAGVKDDFDFTVNYQDIYLKVKQVVEEERFALIEAVAERIAGLVLEAYCEIKEVRVKVSKPEAPLPGVLEKVGIELVRTR